MRALLCMCGFFFTLAATSLVYADDTVELVRFEGPKSSTIQKRIKSALGARSFDVVLVDERGDEPDAIATIVASVVKVKKRWALKIELYEPGSDKAVKKTKLVARNAKTLPGLVERVLWKRIRKSLLRASESQEEDGGFDDEFEDDENDSFDDEKKDGKKGRKGSDLSATKKQKGKEARPASLAASTRPAFDGSVALGPRVVSRRFGYKDDLFQALTTFSVPAMAAMALEAEYYPLPEFGVAAGLSYTPSFNSELNEVSDDSFPTTSMSFTAGGRYRRELGGVPTHFDLDYGGHNFTIKGSTTAKPPIPNVRYRFVRAGAGASISLMPRVTVGGQAGYRFVFSSGEIATQAYFPRLDAAAVDGRVALTLAVLPSWKVEAAGTVERYFFSMNPAVGDSPIAGGGADQYLGGQLVLKYQPAP